LAGVTGTAVGKLALATGTNRGDGPNEMGANLPAVQREWWAGSFYEDNLIQMARRVLSFLPLALLVLFASCKEPTQVSVIVRSNVPYETGNGIAIWVSRSGAQADALVQSTDAWLADGELGDVVVVPGDAAKDSALTVRVTMGLRGKPARECTDNSADLKRCIVARRKLSFVPHTRLRVPVVMYLACEGVKCDADSTCGYLGQCVSAQVDPQACATADGCALPGDPRFVPGVTVDAGAVPGTDTGTDAGARATELTAGESHTCARLEDGTVKCWGVNGNGPLGLGDVLSRGDAPGEMGASLPAVAFGPGRTPLQVTAGEQYTCARLDDGTIKCWGINIRGQLGLGDVLSRGDAPGEMGASLPIVDLGTGRTALEVTSGDEHTCGRLDDGTIKCWGINSNGQLGLGDTQYRGDGPGEMGASLPIVALGPGRTALQFTAGNAHTCARLDDGTVKCWGRNDFGELGLGDTQQRGDGPGEMGASLPIVALGPGRTALQVTAGEFHTCARLDNGTVKCWGLNSDGQLGLGDTQQRGDGAGEMGATLPAVDLGPGRTALQVTVGPFHTCARLDDGTVKCWGINSNGQLGLGDVLSRGDGPGEMGANLPAVSLGPGRTAMQITGRGGHVCALLDDGTVKCWGSNEVGQLGLGDTQHRGDGPGEMGAALPVVPLK
jgi:alpha-tubulin suppressor-like RCC1 family protein